MIIYVLDTSAILAYVENEEGVKEIEDLLHKAIEEEIDIYVSVVSYIEIYYISQREQGEKVANDRLNLLAELPLKQEHLGEHLIKIIGKIKATKSMSFADCCIAGLAKYKKATLVHKDPEYEQIEGLIKQIKLPYKNIR
jgi:predicted nucleic acid-binding protein